MTDHQALVLRTAVLKGLEEAFGRVNFAFVLISQDQESGDLEVITNAKRKQLLPELLADAAELTRTPAQRTRLS